MDSLYSQIHTPLLLSATRPVLYTPLDVPEVPHRRGKVVIVVDARAQVRKILVKRVEANRRRRPPAALERRQEVVPRLEK